MQPQAQRHTIHGRACGLTAATIMFLVLVPWVLLATGPASAVPLKDLGTAPDFRLESQAGEQVGLAEHLARGPVIVDFWATWCGPCRRAMPHLQAIYEGHREQGLTVLALSQDDPRSQAKIGPFIRAQKLTFPVLLDTDSRVSRLYRVATVPTTFLIAPDGRIVAMHRGFRPGEEKQLAAEVEALFASLATEE